MRKFGPLSTRDAMAWMLGKKIGEGQYRDVYEAAFVIGSVIKWEGAGTQFCNVTEYQIWEELKDTALGKWLAPVYGISPGGIWLLQARCEPMRKQERPREAPEFFADFKAENWGILKGRPVCFDYGNHNLFTSAAKRAGLKKVKWLE